MKIALLSPKGPLYRHRRGIFKKSLRYQPLTLTTLAARLRARGVTVVLGGPHVTLVPQEVRQHADAIVVGYAEDSWPQLLRDFAAGALRPEYRQAPTFSLDRPDMPFARRGSRT